MSRCLPYECCFYSGELSCYEANKETCDKHEPCQAVFPDLSQPTPSFTTPRAPTPKPIRPLTNQPTPLPVRPLTPAPTPAPTPPPQPVATNGNDVPISIICSPLNLDQYGEDCKSRCSPYECCFYSGPESCFEANKKVCEEHALCEEIFNTDNESLESELSEENIARVCGLSMLLVSSTECQMLCDGSECCFDDYAPNNCSRESGQESFCVTRGACKVLYN